MKKHTIAIILLSAAVSALTTVGVMKITSNDTPDYAYSDSVSYNGNAPQRNYFKNVSLSQDDYPDFTFAAETAVEAVVYVEVTITTTTQYQIDPFFRFFFGDEYSNPQSREQKASGSGVIIRNDGYIVTNNHVVQNASKVSVTLNDDRTFDATVIGTDAATDIALLKIEATGLPSLEFADSDKLRLGEWVLAIGSPYDLRSTITAGIVSAKGRQMPNYTGEFKIESFIQTDAAVNPGNSGGALVNKAGQLVGVNTAIISQTGSYAGYSFAVPTNIVSKVVGDLMDFGSVKRALLGITMSPIDDARAKDLKLPYKMGVYVESVVSGSAADKAGLKQGDVITRIADVDIKTTSDIQVKVNSYHPGDKATLVYIRDGKSKTCEVIFQGTAQKTGTVAQDGSISFYGASIKTASAETLRAMGLKSGVEVVTAGDGALGKAGVSDGFIILYVNDQPVSSAKEVVDIASRSKRSVYIEGVTLTGRKLYFAFAKE